MDGGGGEAKDTTGSSEAEAVAKAVDTFISVTSSTRDEALFFLESHDWAIDAAVHSYFDSVSATDDPPYHLEEGVHPQEVDAAPIRQDKAAAMSSGSGSKDKKPAAKSSGGRPTIHTLADLNRQQPGPGSDDDSDEPQEYYTGGEKSGMLVQDPTKGNHDIDSIFDQARQMGAMQGPFEDQNSSASSRSFTGTGRLLSGETVPSVPQPPQNIVHNIYFWTNGFTVNDGPLRRFDDPENAAFLESIKKSECPKELEPADRRSMVHVNLMKREEKCPEPVKRSSPFQGLGRTLGGGSSSTAAESATATAAAPSSTASPPVGLSVDDSLPSTSIQLRLLDGTRMVARFNTHHTIGDMRAFIDASRPGAARNYRLQTVNFPPQVLTDVSMTIEQAGLANSVVIQKL